MESETDPIEVPAPVRKRRPRKPKPEEPVFHETDENPLPPETGALEFPEGLAAEWPVEPGRSIKDHSVLILTLAFVLFLISQAADLSQSANALHWQARNLDRQVEGLDATKSNLVALVQQRQILVDQSQRVTSSYNELLNDLIRLAETDTDARAVVEKFQIKSAGGTPGASLPASDPSQKK
jgi:hypothetical protein